MSRGKLTVIGVVIFLFLLVEAAPLTSGNCNLPLPCQQGVTSAGPGLYIENNGQGSGIQGGSDNRYGVEGISVDLAGIYGYSTNGAGVHGNSPNGPGVWGTTIENDGVKGESQAPSASGVYGKNIKGGNGVTGTANAFWPKAGVWGDNWGTGPGVRGTSATGFGVWAEGASGLNAISKDPYGTAVRGQAAGGTGVRGVTMSASSEIAGVTGDNGGSGPGVYGTSINGNGIFGSSINGRGGFFQIINAANSKPAFQAQTAGTGMAGIFLITNSTNASAALKAQTAGSGPAGSFQITKTTNKNTALLAQTAGTGWAAQFYGTTLNTSRGVYIKTNGGTALQVAGGTKSAVVDTSKGKRALYAEEASEVYFIDYGFGKLKDGKVVIPIEPLFAETVNVQEPYHVFLQARGNPISMWGHAPQRASRYVCGAGKITWSSPTGWWPSARALRRPAWRPLNAPPTATPDCNRKS